MTKPKHVDTTPYEFGMAEMERKAAQRSVKKVGRHQSLVTRLRTTCRRGDQSGNMDDYSVSNRSITNIADKLDAVGEALAYLIEKKHMKLHTKKRGG